MKKQIIYLNVFVFIFCSTKIVCAQDYSFGKCCDQHYPSIGCDVNLDLAKERLYFSGMQEPLPDYAGVKASVGIGYNCGAALYGKLSVSQANNTGTVSNFSNAGFFHNEDVTNDAPIAFDKRAVYGVSWGYFNTTDPGIKPAWLNNIGGEFEASGSEGTNIGVRGRAGYTDMHVGFGIQGIGGLFHSRRSTKVNFGVWTKCDPDGSANNYGIYAETTEGLCQSGGPCPQAAGFFSGDVFITKQLEFLSDANLKENIKPMQNAIDVIKSLNPKTYNFKREQFKTLNLPEGSQDGLIAQDVQKVLPNLIGNFKIPPTMDKDGNVIMSEDNNTYLAVNYVGLIPILIGAVKEQQESIEKLQAQLADANIQRRGSSEDHTINVDLSSAKTIILNQNSPNPFSEETYIKYSIPENVSKAAIVIYDNSGEVIKTVVIEERGNGTLHIYAEKLSSGTYTYSLIADGKTIDTKKMVCQK